MIETLGKSSNLDIENFLTVSLHALRLGDERMRLNGTFQLELATDNRLAGDAHHRLTHTSLSSNEGRIHAALGTQTLHINLFNLNLRLEVEAVALAEQLTVFVNDSIAAIDDVLRRLTKATATIDIARHCAGTLLTEQCLQVVVLTYQFIASREVQDDIGSRQRETIAGRCRCPYILAYLNAEVDTVGCREELRIGGDTNGTACQIDVGCRQIAGRCEPTLFVKLAIVRQIGLGYHT